MTSSIKTVFGFASEKDAALANALIGEMPGFEDCPLVLRDDGGNWLLECYDGGALAGEDAGSMLEGLKVTSIAVETIPDADWVRETQKALPPVRAGRFAIHGSHDRAAIVSQWAIEIDAGRAFGTAHHGTTRGCLLELDRLWSQVKPSAVLDLGTGSGVLAIAAAKAFSIGRRSPLWISIRSPSKSPAKIAAKMARRTSGFSLARGRSRISPIESAPFDLVLANILAKPLLKLAPRLRDLTRVGGLLILSGLLSGQAREIRARYRSSGFRLVRRRDLEGWATLTLMRVASAHFGRGS